MNKPNKTNSVQECEPAVNDLRRNTIFLTFFE